MNRRTEALLRKYRPIVAVVAYEGNNRDYYLESHAINEAGQLLEGKPLKQETISGIVDFFFDERQNRVQVGGMIPENLLQFDVLPGGKYTMTWYRPAEQRILHFSEQLHLPSGTAWVPPMVYRVENATLYVFALASSERPSDGTRYYQAPYHNVSSGGQVCLGSAKVKAPEKRTYSNVMKYWEDMFWLSEFTHLAGGSNPTKTNLNILWKRMIEEQLPAFPVDELIEYTKKTLKDLL